MNHVRGIPPTLNTAKALDSLECGSLLPLGWRSLLRRAVTLEQPTTQKKTPSAAHSFFWTAVANEVRHRFRKAAQPQVRSHSSYSQRFLAPNKSITAALALTVSLLLSLNPTPLFAQDAPAISPAVKQSVDKASAFLLTQLRAQGCFLDQDKKDPVPQHSGAMTALAIMGLSSVGHMPTDPTPEGRAVAKGLKFMTDSIVPNEDGYLGQSDRSRMYGHGIMTLMYAEMVGQTQEEEIDKKLRRRLQNAVDLIMRSQDVVKSEANRGGWRYEPTSSDSDISVSVWQVMSLRAAKNAGVEVPKEAIDKAVAYIKRSYRSERDAAGLPKDIAAAFSYEPYGGRQTFSTTAAGILSLQVCAEYDAPEVVGGSNYLIKNPPAPNEPWFFYGTYYYAQGMYQRGGEQASVARQKTEKMLLEMQLPNGSWQPRNGNEKNYGPVYATSLALLSLSVHHHFLPIYQK